MQRVGIRELRQRASELLRLVEAGETVEVTDRGRPVALLTPLPAGDPLSRLRARGETIEPVGTFDDLEPPIPLPPGYERPSEVLRRLRDDER